MSCELHSDSMGLIKAVRLGLAGSLSSRRRRDVLDLRDSLLHQDLSLVMHIEGKSNVADVGTKPLTKTSGAHEPLIQLIKHGRYKPKLSRDHERTFGVSAVGVYDLMQLYGQRPQPPPVAPRYPFGGGRI